MDSLQADLQSLRDARRQVYGFFGLPGDFPYRLDDLTRCPWIEGDEEVTWAEPEDLDRFVFEDCCVSSEQYSNCRWSAGGYTLFVVYVGDDKEAWLFSDALKMEEDGE